MTSPKLVKWGATFSYHSPSLYTTPISLLFIFALPLSLATSHHPSPHPPSLNPTHTNTAFLLMALFLIEIDYLYYIENPNGKKGILQVHFWPEILLQSHYPIRASLSLSLSLSLFLSILFLSLCRDQSMLNLEGYTSLLWPSGGDKGHQWQDIAKQDRSMATAFLSWLLWKWLLSVICFHILLKKIISAEIKLQLLMIYNYNFILNQCCNYPSPKNDTN